MYVQKAIVETALGLFLKQGVRATTMDQISEQLGISKKTLYEHFASKEALMEAGAEVLLSRTEAELKALREQHSSNALLAMAATASYAYRMLASMNPILFLELRRLPWSLRRSVLGRIQQIIAENLTSSLRQGIAEGTFRADIPLHVLPLWFGYVVAYIVFNSDFTQEAGLSVADAYAESLLLFLYGLSTEKGRHLLETYKQHIRETYAR